MKKTAWVLMAVLVLAAPATMAAEKVIFEQDFESPDAAATISAKDVVLTEPGPESRHSASRAANATHNNITLKTEASVEDGIELTFEYRIEVREGEVGYLGIYLTTPQGKKMISTVKPSPSWTSARVPLATFRIDPGSKVKEPITTGETINTIQFYGRSKTEKADHTVYIDNVKLVVK